MGLPDESFRVFADYGDCVGENRAASWLPRASSLRRITDSVGTARASCCRPMSSTRRPTSTKRGDVAVRVALQCANSTVTSNEPT
jgi:hypothetical protein